MSSPSVLHDLRGASPDPRRAAPPVRGSLDVRPRLLDSRLTLTVEALAVDARLAGIDESGDWRFEGVAISGEHSTPVIVRARHNGVYRHGERETTWLSLSAEGDAAGRHGLLGRRPRHRHLFAVDVNAEPAGA